MGGRICWAADVGRPLYSCLFLPTPRHLLACCGKGSSVTFLHTAGSLPTGQATSLLNTTTETPSVICNSTVRSGSLPKLVMAHHMGCPLGISLRCHQAQGARIFGLWSLGARWELCWRCVLAGGSMSPPKLPCSRTAAPWTRPLQQRPRHRCTG